MDDVLTFVSHEEESEVTSAPWCWHYFTIIDDEGKETWAFDAYEAYKDAKRCGPNFPLRYGKAPQGAKTETAALPIERGRLYVITGGAGGHLEGAFYTYRAGNRIVVENVDPQSAQVRDIEERHWAIRSK